MTLVAVLRRLWRYRWLSAAALVLAVVASVSVLYRIAPPTSMSSRSYEVGVATSTALIDTPNSQAVDLGSQAGGDVATLTAKATLLASLMTSSPIKDEIARSVGVNPERLASPAPGSAPGPNGAAPAVTGPHSSGPGAVILRASVPDLGDSGGIPVINVETQAPSAAVAGRLANQAFVILKSHLQSVAGSEGIPATRRLVVKTLGPAAAGTSRKGPSKALAIAAFIFVLGAGLGAILGFEYLVRTWRATTAEDEGEAPANRGPMPRLAPVHQDFPPVVRPAAETRAAGTTSQASSWSAPAPLPPPPPPAPPAALDARRRR